MYAVWLPFVLLLCKWPHVVKPNPVGMHSTPGTNKISARQYTDDQFQNYKDAFVGIYWDEAKDTCSPANFAILAEATRMLYSFTDTGGHPGDNLTKTQAWHEFFVSPQRQRRGERWVGRPSENVHNRAYQTYLAIMNNIKQVHLWPSTGKPRNGEYVQAKQVTYTCNPPIGYKHKCQPGARQV